MTGPEHYAAAEVLLANAERHTTEDPGDMRIAEVSAATAQVHATLALAAATAGAGDLVRWDENQGPTDWHQAIYPNPAVTTN